jgi:hypothetical protein
LNKVSPRSFSFWQTLPREKGLFNPRQTQAGLKSPIHLDHRLSIWLLLFSRFDEPDTTPLRVFHNLGGRAADIQLTAFARCCTLLGI